CSASSKDVCGCNAGSLCSSLVASAAHHCWEQVQQQESESFLGVWRYHEVDKHAEKEMTMKPRPFRFAVLCEQMDTQRTWVDKARQIEESGYATLLIRDHFV